MSQRVLLAIIAFTVGQVHSFATSVNEFIQTNPRLSLGELTELIQEADPPLTELDVRNVWLEFRRQQSPLISHADLSAMYTAKMDAVEQIHLAFSSTNNKNQEEVRRYAYARDGENLFSSVHLNDHLVKTYGLSENVLREYRGDIPEKGWLTKPHRYSRTFHDRRNPLALAMLLDARDNTGLDATRTDMVAFLQDTLTVVFEKTQTIDGVECVVVSDLTSTLYLDPNRDFALVKMDINSFEFDGDSRGFKVEPRFSRINSEFVDYGNGIWLPKKSTFTELFEGTDTIERVVLLDEATVNKQIPGNLFEDIFPDGIIVIDNINNITYGTSVDTTISQLMSSSVTLLKEQLEKDVPFSKEPAAPIKVEEHSEEAPVVATTQKSQSQVLFLILCALGACVAGCIIVSKIKKRN